MAAPQHAQAQALSADFTTASQITVETDVDPQLPLAPDAELVLYRIAQEGLTNVARHSGASRVVLTMGLSEGGVLLTIEDDGDRYGRATRGCRYPRNAGTGPADRRRSDHRTSRSGRD